MSTQLLSDALKYEISSFVTFNNAGDTDLLDKRGALSISVHKAKEFLVCKLSTIENLQKGQPVVNDEKKR